MLRLVDPTSVMQAPGRHRGPHRREQRVVGEHGGAQDHQVSSGHALGQVGGDTVDRAVAHGGSQARQVAAHADDLARRPPGPHRLGHRAAQESDADDRQPLDHGAFLARTWRRALTSRRFSCGVPMVMRSADSIPKGVSGRTITPSLSRR